jgi:hypothetical protein
MLNALRAASSLAKTDFADESPESSRTAVLVVGDQFWRAMDDRRALARDHADWRR